MAKTNAPMSEDINPNNLNAGTTIKGDISCAGDIRIAGSVEGTIVAQGKVIIATSGVVKGEISCKNSQIEGKVEGRVSVAELLSLKATSTIIGDIVTGKLAIEPGAHFTGNCKMSGGAGTSALNSDNDQKKK